MSRDNLASIGRTNIKIQLYYKSVSVNTENVGTIYIIVMLDTAVARNTLANKSHRHFDVEKKNYCRK